MLYKYFLVDKIEDRYLILDIQLISGIEAITRNIEFMKQKLIKRWILCEKGKDVPTEDTLRLLGNE